MACVLGILGMFSVLAFSMSASAQTKTLKIGLITSMTGPMAPGFREIVEAAKPAQDLMNQRGGVTVKGEKYTIEILTTDDQSSPSGAVARDQQTAAGRRQVHHRPDLYSELYGNRVHLGGSKGSPRPSCQHRPVALRPSESLRL